MQQTNIQINNGKKTTILCILDGFGLLPASGNNSIALAKMPNLRRMMSQYLWFGLNADGAQVGQEDESVGNSEVGHMNIGGLKLIPQLSWEITHRSSKNYDLDLDENGTLKASNQLFDPKHFYNLIWSEKNQQQEIEHDFDSLIDNNYRYEKTTVVQNQFQTTGIVHLVGLFSTGKIHSDQRHLAGAIEAVNSCGAKKIVLHLISDGRDSDRQSLYQTWQKFVADNQTLITEVKDKLFLGSLGGRYWAMDRDKNFDRVATGIRAMLDPILATNSSDYSTIDEYFYQNYHADYWNVESYYSQNDLDSILQISDISTQIKVIADINYNKQVYDENLYPIGIKGISLNDDIWLFNFRVDRMRQLTSMLIKLNQDFSAGWSILSNNNYDLGEPNRELILSYNQLQELDIKNLENYASGYFPIFQSMVVSGTLAEYISKIGKNQLHIAETEKYNHITYFINGAKTIQQPGEDWKLIDSNKVESHAQMPAMKAIEITDYILDKGIGNYDYILCNYANPDMLGHTGDIAACIQGMEVLDQQLGRLFEACKLGHSLLITADHGNAEFVGQYQKDGKELVDTEHNPNLVPCLMVDVNTKINSFDANSFLDAVNQCLLEIKGAGNQFLGTQFDFNRLDYVIEQRKNLNLDLSQNWLNSQQIIDSQLPLWYVGILFLSLPKLKKS